MADTSDTTEILNRDGSPWRCNRAKYDTTSAALLTVLPDAPPGLTYAQMRDAAVPHLDPALFPGGEKAGWWVKSVQLDHEARGLIQRTATSPLRFHRS